MFELTSPTLATLISVTPRTEIHGEDRVFAISLGIKITAPNTILDGLSPTLRQTLYKAVEGQEQLPGVEESTPLLRTRGIDLLSLAGKPEGWTLTVDHGIDEGDPITLGGCKVDHFKVDPHEGGTVDLMFRIGSTDIDATEAGLLCSKLSQEISIQLTAPERPADAIDASSSADDLPPTAGDLFAAEHDGPEDGEDWPFPGDPASSSLEAPR